MKAKYLRNHFLQCERETAGFTWIKSLFNTVPLLAQLSRQGSSGNEPFIERKVHETQCKGSSLL